MKMLRYKISVAKDLSVGSLAGLNTHGWAAPPAPPVPAVPTAECPLPAFWPPGAALGANKLTKRVTHRRAAIVQDGHDLGWMIPHVSTPVLNALTPIHVLFSKRKTAFFEPRIRFEKRFATSCSALAMPPTPMMSCNDPISMPIASMVTNEWLGRVEFGMSPSSYVVSFGMMAASVVADSVLKGLWGKGPSASSASSTLALWRSQFASKLAGGRKPKEILVKLGLEVATGLGKLAMSQDSTRTVSVSLPGSPFIRASVTGDGSGSWSLKETLHGLSPSTGDNAWADTWQRLGSEEPWGADLG